MLACMASRLLPTSKVSWHDSPAKVYLHAPALQPLSTAEP